MNTSTLSVGRSSFGSSDFLGRVVGLLEVLRAASRVAASVENRRAPNPDDLTTLGIDDIPGVTALVVGR
jgi:hypothetical protein